MGLPARRSASRSPGAAGPRRGVLQLLPLLLLLLRPGACGAAAQGEAEAPTLYLWKTADKASPCRALDTKPSTVPIKSSLGNYSVSPVLNKVNVSDLAAYPPEFPRKRKCITVSELLSLIFNPDLVALIAEHSAVLARPLPYVFSIHADQKGQNRSHNQFGDKMVNYRYVIA
ncbi:hypothetical protein PANDA_020219 [Ailuropoda melanoleuca]|uniref:Uncharacterized protein n=1 Tax=Ailuropoda melanoleuca TaxID=9646 RepID=D2I3U1_AILME|nr:hypothetical protein PANDA_020219 [Ailuropoda melanoleuca]